MKGPAFLYVINKVVMRRNFDSIRDMCIQIFCQYKIYLQKVILVADNYRAFHRVLNVRKTRCAQTVPAVWQNSMLKAPL